MDRLVDHLFVFEGDGVVQGFPGKLFAIPDFTKRGTGRQTQRLLLLQYNPLHQLRLQSPSPPKQRLSFKEKREFEILEKEIAALTKEKQVITEKLNNGNTPFEELQALSSRIGQVTQELDQKEIRWLELSEMIG